MDWDIVCVSNIAKIRNVPFASIGFGRLSLNAAACRLVKEIHQYPYIEMLQSTAQGQHFVGIRFLKEKTENTIKVVHRENEKKYKSSVTINCKSVLEELFNTQAIQNKITRYMVQKDPDADNILMMCYSVV